MKRDCREYLPGLHCPLVENSKTVYNYSRNVICWFVLGKQQKTAPLQPKTHQRKKNPKEKSI